MMDKKQIMNGGNSMPRESGHHFFARLGAFIALLVLNVGALATSLESVDYSSLPGGKVKITASFSEAVDSPKSFATDEPARIVLDFENVKNNLDERTKQLNIGLTRSVSAVEAGNRTRMVINLTEKTPYTISASGNMVTITVDGHGQTIAATETVVDINDIDFRRGDMGQARLMIDFSKEGTVMDIRQERNNIVIDLMGANLPERLHRRLDVVDFATPVQIIDSEKRGSNTRLTLSTKGEFEHLAYQSEKSLVVEVKPLPKQVTAAQQKGQFGYKGDKLSLNFQNIEVRAVLQLLADFTGMNLVTSDTVQGNLTLRLKNVPWDQALDIILKTKGLAMRQNGNVMLIAPATEIAAREKQELEAQNQLIKLEPLYSEIIEINFAKADELATILQSQTAEETGAGISGFLSDRGSVTVDQRTNSLLVRDTADQLVEIGKLIESLDIPVRQVLIESRIVIANDDFTKELGVRFGASSSNHTRSGLVNNAASSATLNDISNSGSELTTSGAIGGPLPAGASVNTNQGLNVNLPVANPAGSIALALAKLPLGTLLQLELSAMQQEGKGEIISSPRVITSNQKQAIIEQGTEIPYQEASSSGATSVSFKEATLKLAVTPQITPDDRIIMDLEVSKDEVGEIYLGVPSIDTRSVQTQVLVDNGETVVLGGIYEQKSINDVTRVPFFSDLPYVGFLFRTKYNEDTQRELLVFVTPKIIKDELKF